MKCPNCGGKNIDVKKGDGFSVDTKECNICGQVWTNVSENVVVIKVGKQILLG